LANIIFIHGLGGASIRTWCHQKNPAFLWPQKWLPKEQGMENVRIYTFGYSAGVGTTKESSSTILDFAKNLNLELLTSDLGDAPIIFVAHSLGGLVVKRVSVLMREIREHLC
jgi:pimeloyl-ACP methyl ester carboxylesterase